MSGRTAFRPDDRHFPKKGCISLLGQLKLPANREKPPQRLIVSRREPYGRGFSRLGRGFNPVKNSP